ncbi:MAG: S1C family serine protease [Aggregatilineales bacterium]
MTDTSLLRQLYDDLASVTAAAQRSLVQIANGRGGAGAGTIWHSDGLIITNYHVIAGRGGLRVTLRSGETLPARVLAASPQRDLAALVVKANGLPTIELGDSRALRPGQWVLALGHPWGVPDAVTSGVVIALGPQIGDIRSPNGQDWLAVSVHVRPGHSGGPLIDARGRMVGVNTIMNGPDVGVAVPVHVVKAFLKENVGAKIKCLRPEPVIY